MRTFLTRSLDPEQTDEELEHKGAYSTSFLSFERAIQETNSMAGIYREVQGYKVTEQGIVIIWK
ncbi:MAG: hypothetical protein PQJ49_04520 [Sphaerochaetaceae bacterium]|nr:hypothetical protein [Sphaerochaetaceae bacterium]